MTKYQNLELKTNQENEEKRVPHELYFTFQL